MRAFEFGCPSVFHGMTLMRMHAFAALWTRGRELSSKAVFVAFELVLKDIGNLAPLRHRLGTEPLLPSRRDVRRLVDGCVLVNVPVSAPRAFVHFALGAYHRQLALSYAPFSSGPYSPLAIAALSFSLAFGSIIPDSRCSSLEKPQSLHLYIIIVPIASPSSSLRWRYCPTPKDHPLHHETDTA